MTQGRGQQEVVAGPKQSQGVGWQEQQWAHGGEVVGVLHRVHGQASEGLHVSVPVVERVHVAVEGRYVEQAVGEVEVELPVEGDTEQREAEHSRVPRARERLLVSDIVQATCRIAV